MLCSCFETCIRLCVQVLCVNRSLFLTAVISFLSNFYNVYKPHYYSSDGYEFFADMECVQASGMIQNITQSPTPWMEMKGKIPQIKLEAINGHILEKVVQYFYFKRRYNNTPQAVEPDFPIPVEDLIPMMMASHFLDT